MNKPILTFVVPVYNVEKYLKECYYSIFVKKIINQIEIILIDDGSTDNSKKICDKLAKNKNTFVIHKPNGGLSSARNAGLKVARGRYITFVDSDDIVNSESLEKIIDYLSKVDVDLIFLNMSKFYNDGFVKDIGEHIDREKLISCNKNEFIKYISNRPKFPASACAKIYLKDYLYRNNIFFPNDNRISEDMGFSFRCILYATSFDKVDLPFYYYRQNRDNSITNNVTFKSFEGLSQFIVDCIALYTTDGSPNNDDLKNMFNFLSYEYTILLWHYNFLNSVDKLFALNFLREYKYVMKWSITRNNKIIKFLLNIFGIRITSKFLFFLKKVK